MRQFLSLRSKINVLKDEQPTSIDRSSTISMTSPKSTDDDVFFRNSRASMRSETSFRTESYSSGSEEKMSL